jgi:hypothetical protein
MVGLLSSNCGPFSTVRNIIAPMTLKFAGKHFPHPQKMRFGRFWFAVRSTGINKKAEEGRKAGGRKFCCRAFGNLEPVGSARYCSNFVAIKPATTPAT